MEQALYTSLASLANDIHFEVQKITEEDNNTHTNPAVGSCLKIVIHRQSSNTAVYFYRSGDYSVIGPLSVDERSLLDGWLATVQSKKIEGK